MKQIPKQELIDLFEPSEGGVNFYYGRIGNGKTYAATADVLELLSRGEVVYVNWRINYDGYDERNNWRSLIFKLFLSKYFYRFPPENLHYFDPDDVTIEFLESINDAHIFIDEGQWIFDSYEGTKFSKAKRRLILHTRHLNRTLNIISQRTQAVQVSARGQVNRFYKCEKKLQYPFLIFKRTEFQDMKDNDVDETTPISTKVYFAKKKVMRAYDTKYMRKGVASSQEIYFDAWLVSFPERAKLLYVKCKDTLQGFKDFFRNSRELRKKSLQFNSEKPLGVKRMETAIKNVYQGDPNSYTSAKEIQTKLPF